MRNSHTHSLPSLLHTFLPRTVSQAPRMHASPGAHACQRGTVQRSVGNSATPWRTLQPAPAALCVQSMQRNRTQHAAPCAPVSCSAIGGIASTGAQPSLQRSSSYCHHPLHGNSTSGSSHAWAPRRAAELSAGSAHANRCHEQTPTQSISRAQRMRRHASPVQIISASDIPMQSRSQATLQPSPSGSSGKVLMPQVFIGAAGTQGRKRRMEDMHFCATLHPYHGVQRHCIGGDTMHTANHSSYHADGNGSRFSSSSNGISYHASSSNGISHVATSSNGRSYHSSSSNGCSNNGNSYHADSRANSNNGTSNSYSYTSGSQSQTNGSYSHANDSSNGTYSHTNGSRNGTNGSSSSSSSSSALDANGSCFGTAVMPHVLMAGVLDGHAGSATAKYAAQELPGLLHSTLKVKRLYSKKDAGGHACAKATAAALAYAFTCFDRWWDSARCDPQLTPHGWDESGATAVVSLLLGDLLVVGHSGDSSALLLRGGHTMRLSTPHRPCCNRAEAERVVRAGGRLVVAAPGQPVRVVGTSTSTRTRGAMITRALGDFAFKSPQPLLLSQPDVTHQHLTTDDTLLLMLSDGVTDVMSDDDVMAAASLGMAKARCSTSTGAHLAQAAAQAVVDAALARGSMDNITALAMLYEWSA